MVALIGVPCEMVTGFVLGLYSGISTGSAGGTIRVMLGWHLGQSSARQVPHPLY